MTLVFGMAMNDLVNSEDRLVELLNFKNKYLNNFLLFIFLLNSKLR